MTSGQWGSNHSILDPKPETPTWGPGKCPTSFLRAVYSLCGQALPRSRPHPFPCQVSFQTERGLKAEIVVEEENFCGRDKQNVQPPGCEQEQEDNRGIEGPGLLESSSRSVGRGSQALPAAQASLSLFLSHIAPVPGADSSFLSLTGKQSLSSVICMEQDSVIFSFSVFDSD